MIGPNPDRVDVIFEVDRIQAALSGLGYLLRCAQPASFPEGEEIGCLIETLAGALKDVSPFIATAQWPEP